MMKLKRHYVNTLPLLMFFFIGNVNAATADEAFLVATNAQSSANLALNSASNAVAKADAASSNASNAIATSLDAKTASLQANTNSETALQETKLTSGRLDSTELKLDNSLQTQSQTNDYFMKKLII
ncbi:hypothetical protein [Pantoea ananatis]|jgi:hypothetical protein|nr:hypothetical protein [Pantoea ananatis]MCW1774729.1 hypothetical protein [Pantoea ananatis]QZE28940.1 hypothetical protein K4732_19055 [Pantoea ananatis]USL58996.1 hypothetical protein IAQ00_04145 [Pantoea ananatis]UYK93063.1 hypothetical protein NG826_00705 [Pantoea ananatis]UYL01861.1 hypothetical protein NG830_00325 [Pantoea ananatis]